MNVSLTPELEQYIQEKVSTGMYYSASEVVREGLRLLKEREQLQQIRLRELRQDIQAGIDSEETTPPGYAGNQGEGTATPSAEAVVMASVAMMEFCANHGVTSMCEQFDMKDVNSAVEHVRSGKVRYRAVLAH